MCKKGMFRPDIHGSGYFRWMDGPERTLVFYESVHKRAVPGIYPKIHLQLIIILNLINETYHNMSSEVGLTRCGILLNTIDGSWDCRDMGDDYFYLIEIGGT